MKTPTHALVAYLLAKVSASGNRKVISLAVLGAIAPDVPLIAIALLCAAEVGILPFSPGFGAAFQLAMDSYYFGTPWFIALHHLLHAPLPLLGLYLLLALFTARGSACRLGGSWFLAGAASHAAIDLVTHAEDGILILWPLDWHYRFDAGVSQWDMGGVGAVLLTLEVSMLVSALFAALWIALRPFWDFLTFEFSCPETTATRAMTRAARR